VSTSNNLALSVLHALDIAVLRRIGKRNYTIYGAVPTFYQSLFPGENGMPCVTPWKYSNMLDFFLDDVEVFFERNNTGSLSSGLWQEDGIQADKQALTAIALNLKGEQVLILRLLNDDFVDRSRILQKAREQLLERRILNNDLEIYKRKASFDALTTLYNRATFVDFLQEELSRVNRVGGDLSLLLIDIDDFKKINDVYGHLAGDMVLSSLGGLLRSLLRNEDMPARYGGEEFVVLAEFTTLNQAVIMAEKIRKAVAAYKFGDLPPVTISIGCATYRLGDSLSGIIQRADLALYDAKNSGKNKVGVR
jgi:diguanylate cyclase (GGDEF)-like protein